MGVGRLAYFLKDPSRIELMLDIHDRIMQAICARDADRAIRELEIHYDMQIEQIYEQNDDAAAEQPDRGIDQLHDYP